MSRGGRFKAPWSRAVGPGRGEAVDASRGCYPTRRQQILERIIREQVVPIPSQRLDIPQLALTTNPTPHDTRDRQSHRSVQRRALNSRTVQHAPRAKP